MNDTLIGLQREINDLKRQLERFQSGQFSTHEMTWLSAPLTSTSWDGDAFSTTAKTLIDLSAVFSAPAGIRAVSVYWAWNDSGSAGADCWLCLSPNNTAGSGIFLGAYGLTNDKRIFGSAMIPCDANGDIYYQINASGASTMDVYLQIWGYER